MIQTLNPIKEKKKILKIEKKKEIEKDTIIIQENKIN
jgi:hypothetical protein